MDGRHWLLVMAALALMLPLAACGGSGEAPPVRPLPAAASAGAAAVPAPLTVDAVTEALTAAGLTVKTRSREGRSIYGSGARRSDLLIGPSTVQVFVFPSMAVTKQAVAGVSPDGTSISVVSRRGAYEGFAMYEFIGPVHHFTRDRVIALFVERRPRPPDQPMGVRDARVLEVLETVMGPQFAGQGGLEMPHLEGNATGAAAQSR
jgi:hypothetical protein